MKSFLYRKNKKTPIFHTENINNKAPRVRYAYYLEKRSGEESQQHGHWGKLPKQNTNGLCSKIKHQQMGCHKTVKLL